MKTIYISVDDVFDILSDCAKDKGFHLVDDYYGDQSRWTATHFIVFKKDESFFRFYYEEALTEYQESYYPTETEKGIPCKEVVAKEKVITIWEDVKSV